MHPIKDTKDELPPEAIEFIGRCNAFGDGRCKQCPICDIPVAGVTLYEKSEPDMYSLYIEPCGHRLGLWPKAPDWIEADGLPVEIIEFGK